MSVACIILNYNSYVETKKLIEKVKLFGVFRYIIIVDNKSNDDSYIKLLKYQNTKIHVIQADKNGGFGYGNNFGVIYAKSLGAHYALIANPDVDFKEEIILPMLEVFKQKRDATVVVPASYKNNHIRAYHSQNNLQIAMSSSLILNKLFGNFLGRLSLNKLQLDQPVEIGVFSGALFMVDIPKFIKVGMFDEHVFLYFEESILAERIHGFGFKIYMLLDINFKHIGSTSVKKNISSFTKIKKYEVISKKYFLKSYRDAGNFKLLVYSLFFYESIFEMYLYGFIKNKI